LLKFKNLRNTNSITISPPFTTYTLHIGASNSDKFPKGLRLFDYANQQDYFIKKAYLVALNKAKHFYPV